MGSLIEGNRVELTGPGGMELGRVLQSSGKGGSGTHKLRIDYNGQRIAANRTQTNLIIHSEQKCAAGGKRCRSFDGTGSRAAKSK